MTSVSPGSDHDTAWKWIRSLALIGDFVAILISLIIAGSIGASHPAGGIQGNDPWGTPWAVLAISVALVLALHFQRLYRVDELLGGHTVYGRITRVVTFAVLAYLAASYLAPTILPLPGRSELVASWFVLTMTISANRFLIRRGIHVAYRQGHLIRKLLIVGANQSGVALARQLNAPGRHGCAVVGFTDDYLPLGTEVVDGLLVLGHSRDLAELAKVHRIQEAIVLPHAIAWESFRNIAERSASVPMPFEVHLAPNMYDLVTSGLEVRHRAYVPMVALRIARVTGLYGAIKEIADRSLAMVGVCLAAVAVPFVFLVKHTRSADSTLFQTNRIYGQFGHRVDLLQFSPELGLPPLIARLPSFWNVLKGEVSAIGPRPTGVAEDEEVLRLRRKVAALKPGLTGLWRLRTDAQTPQELGELDVYYARNYTISLDVQIFVDTAKRILWFGKGRQFNRWTINNS